MFEELSVPESRSRKKAKNRSQTSGATPPPGVAKPRGGGRWVVPVMLTLLIVGLLWIVVFYLAGDDIPGMADLGYWNLGIGMGMILLGLITAMKWE
jgi:Cell division protein CrgA